MFFLGTTFFSGRNVIDPSPTDYQNITNVTLGDGSHSRLYVTKNPDIEITNDENFVWNDNTMMDADFSKETFNAGNSNFKLGTTDNILVKCRKVGTFDWITIYAKQVETIEDMSININDYFRPSSDRYEYAIVATQNGIETAYVSKEIDSLFEGLYICDKDNIYGTILDLDFMDTSKDTNASVINMLNNKYPTVVQNGEADYERGTTAGTFLQFDQDCNTVNLSESMKYRDDIKQWLNNRRPKILKFYDGRIWLVNIIGSISDTGDGHNDKRKISFEWVEIGNVNDAETLYNTGLSDVGSEWW